MAVAVGEELGAARRAPRLPGVTPEDLLFLLLVVALLVAVWANAAGSFVPDTVPDLYEAPARLLRADLSTWQSDPFLGSPALQVGRVPVDAVMALVRAAGAGPATAVRLLRSVLLVLAALGAHRLYRELAPRGGMVAGRLTCAAVYTVNPYVVVGASTLPTLLPYALLPWLLVAVCGAVRDPASWRWPAVCAVVFFGMSGIQVGVVPVLQLVAVPCLAGWLHRDGLPWRAVRRGVLRCAVLCLLVSVYWLLPGLAALGAGSGIAGSTETLEAIAEPSSSSEVLRGLGMWTMYGAGPDGPFQPGFTSYLSSVPVVLASGALPALALAGAALSHRRVRVLGLLLVLVAVPVMVGLHPYATPTPFGRALSWGFAHVPGLVAFRTTNKAGGVLMTGIAVLVAVLVEHVAPLLRGRARRAGAAAALAGVLVVAAAPALVGTLYPVRLDVPDYWRSAAAGLDAGPRSGRTLVVPGETQARYRWGYTSPADITTSLLERSHVVRQTVPAGSPEAADLLAALDVGLNESSLPPGSLSALARYLGADSVLVRNDTRWEDVGGARPAAVMAQVVADPGLAPTAVYGSQGENTVGPGDPAAQAADRALPPLVQYAVKDPVPVVRAESVAGTVLLDGDASALPELFSAGALAQRPAMRLAGGLTPDGFAAALGTAGRVVLTDSNRRRVSNPARLSSSTGATLTADEQPERTRTLYGPDQQSVLVLHGLSSLTSSSYGSQFGPVPYGSPALALDGDPTSGWTTGDFGTAVGQQLRLRLDAPTRVGTAVLRPLVTQPVRLSAVRLRVGQVVRDVELPPGRDTVVPVGADGAQDVEVTVLGTQGQGANAVGLAELSVPGHAMSTSVRLPRTTEQLTAGLGDARQRLDAVPVDVALIRAQGDPTTPLDDEERRVDRDLVLPASRDYTLSGSVRVTGATPERDVDQLLGVDPRFSASSTSRWFDDPASRASAAFDGDPLTAWVPGRDAVGESLTVRFPTRQVRQVVVRQDSPVGGLVDLATQARVELGDGRSVTAPLQAGSTTVRLPAGRTDRLTLQITGRAGRGALVRITDLDVAGVRLRPRPPAAGRGCVSAATVDGRAVQVRATGTGAGPGGGTATADLLAGRPVAVAGCTGALLPLAAGPHQVRSTPGLLLDGLHLYDTRPVPRQQPPPLLGVQQHSATSYTVSAPATSAPWYLVLGQAYDTRWRATAGGRDLGPPVVLDGWSTGWIVSDPRAQVVEVRYPPQTVSRAGLALSLVTLGGCGASLYRRRG